MSFGPKRIVVATDFSSFAVAATDAAVELARRFGAHLSLLHIVPLTTYVEYASGMEGAAFATADLHDAVRAAAEQAGLKEQARLQATGVAFDVVTRDGPPPAEICAFAAEVGADLIVVGSHGRTGLTRFLLGSVAETVVRRSTAAVLVVRTPAR